MTSNTFLNDQTPPITCPIFTASKTTPQSPALLYNSQLSTYESLHREIDELCQHYISLGIRESDQLILLIENKKNLILSIWALFRLRVTVFCIDPKQRSFLSPIITLYRPKALVLDDPIHRIRLGMCETDTISYTKTARPRYIHNTFFEEQQATLIQTSGSTGTPKIARHTFGNHYHSALASNTFLKLTENGRYLLTLPLFHVSGLAPLFRTFFSGACLVIDDAKPLLDTIKTHSITHVSLVGYQLYQLLKHDFTKQDHLSLRAVLLGGSAIKDTLIQKGIRAGLPLYKSYGSTELSSQIYTESCCDGCNNSSIFSRIRQLKVSPSGELLIKGKTLFSGYLTRPNEYRLLLDSEGYFATGDLAALNKQGLRILGRKDRLFISGGKNISPEEIEYYLNAFESIISAKVLEKKDPAFGSRPKAILRVAPAFTLQKLLVFLKKNLPKYKLPDWYEIYS